MKNTFTHAFLEKFLGTVVDELDGKWILIGGTVMSILQEKVRPTVGIDLVPLDKAGNEARLKLMDLAERMKLPPEAINLAAEFFLKRIPNWEEELVLLKKGKKGEVYRPSANLFLLSKISRLSETDLADCLAMIKFAEKKECISSAVLEKIKRELKKAEASRGERLQVLLSALTTK